MKRWVYIFVSLLSAFAAGAAPGDGDKSLLWEISGNGLAKPSYLFGTIHVICAGDYLWTKPMERSLAAAGKVCFEMKLDDPALLADAAKSFMDTTGKRIKDYYTPQQYQFLKKFMKDSLGMDIFLYQSMKPIALQSMLEVKSSGCKDQVAYEEKIMGSAKEQGKEVLGLEALSEQTDALASMPDDSVAQELLRDMHDLTKGRQEFQQLVHAYLQQDLPKLYDLLNVPGDNSMDMTVLLDDRNKRWIPRMGKMMQESSVFFAVGAGHLWGTNGVISLLRKSGYTVEPLKN